MERRAAIFSVNVARERKNRELQRYIEGSFGGIGKIAAVGRPRQGLVKKSGALPRFGGKVGRFRTLFATERAGIQTDKNTRPARNPTPDMLYEMIGVVRHNYSH